MTDTVSDVLIQIGIKVANVGDREISAQCPFHPDNHPSFSMNAESGLWICYQCGERGTLEMLLTKVGGESINPTVLLREIRLQAITKPVVVEEPKPEDRLIMQARYKAFKSPPSWATEERMIDPTIAEDYGLKWDKGWVIPIWEPFTNELIGWQFKQIDFVSNYPKAVKKSTTLFGIRELKKTAIVLVESPLDVTRLASVGITALAAYGAFVSKTQIRLLIEVADRVVLALDNDEEGERQNSKLYPYLSKFLPVRTVRFPDGCKDPGDLSDEQALRMFGDF